MEDKRERDLIIKSRSERERKKKVKKEKKIVISLLNLILTVFSLD